MESKNVQDLSRIQAFSDGVFAFAITLLSLNFTVPIGIPSNEISTVLPKQVLDQLPSLGSYIISFIAIGAFWYSHHQKFALIKRYDALFIWLNMFILMAICLLPFTTNLVGDYPSSVFAVQVYCGSIMLICLAFALLWAYATDKKRLVIESTTKKDIRNGFFTIFAIFAIFFTSFLASFFHIDIARYAWILVGSIPFMLKVQSD